MSSPICHMICINIVYTEYSGNTRGPKEPKTEPDVPYVALCAARTLELVFQKVRVVRGGDEVVVQRLAHVLVHALTGRVYEQGFGLVQEHQKAILRHQLLCFGCQGGGKQMYAKSAWCISGESKCLLERISRRYHLNRDA